MRSNETLAASAAAILLLTVICAAAQPDGLASDSSPWRIVKATKLSNVRDGAAAAADSGPQKYLHVEVRFRSPAESQKKHNFRVVNQHGDEVGELWGWNDARSLVIFEGSWGSLVGLYLDGNGHREPLFAAAALPTRTGRSPTPTPRSAATAEVQEATPSLPAQRDAVVANEPQRPVVLENHDQVVARPPERVVVHEPDHVVVGQPDRVVVKGRVGADGVIVVQPGDGRASVGPGGSSRVDVAIHGVDGGVVGSGTLIVNGTGANVTVAGSGSGATGVGNGNHARAGGQLGTGLGTGDGAGSGSGNAPGPDSASGPGTGDGAGSGSENGPGPGGGSGPGAGAGGRNGPGMKSGTGPMSSNGPGTEPRPGPDDQPSLAAMLRTPKPNPETPAFVLYISCGNDASEGIVYQTDEHGRILGKVKLPYTATGIALHREHGLVLAIPRDGGKIMEIDETGKLSTILENDPALVHPVDVGVASNSDTVVAADNIANVLAFTNTAGVKAKIYRRLSGEKWAAQKMSVAVASDKSVIYGFEGLAGVFRCSGDDSTGRAPLLPNYGGVAADPTSTRWAAAQPPNQIYGYDGNELVKKLRLPPNKSHYQGGLLSFGPAGSLCAAVRDSDKTDGDVWLLMYNIDKDEIRSLFKWTQEEIADFVVGPRMPWNRNSPKADRSAF